MAGQITVYPVSAEIVPGGAIEVKIRPGKLHNCTMLGLRPKNKSTEAVLADIKARIGRGDKMRLGDMSWPFGEGTPFFFEYRERIAGHKRAAPDPDAAILRDYERTHGIG